MAIEILNEQDEEWERVSKLRKVENMYGSDRL